VSDPSFPFHCYSHPDMAALNPNRQKFLARLGRKYTVQALRRMGPERRYPILLSLLKQTPGSFSFRSGIA
jgi:hypothetical protein